MQFIDLRTKYHGNNEFEYPHCDFWWWVQPLQWGCGQIDSHNSQWTGKLGSISIFIRSTSFTGKWSVHHRDGFCNSFWGRYLFQRLWRLFQTHCTSSTIQMDRFGLLIHSQRDSRWDLQGFCKKSSGLVWKVPELFARVVKWDILDSNQWPLPCQDSALNQLS